MLSRLNFRGACHQLDDDGSNFDDYSVQQKTITYVDFPQPRQIELNARNLRQLFPLAGSGADHDGANADGDHDGENTDGDDGGGDDDVDVNDDSDDDFDGLLDAQDHGG